MSGIIFFKSKDVEKVKNFYINKIGMDLWLEQGGCSILKHGNLLLGFCDREIVENPGIITIFYKEKSKIDKIYSKLKNIAISEPQVNEKYKIYHFFIKDPEGRTVEFQTFLHTLDPYMQGDEILITRRSIRKFQDKKIPRKLMLKLFDTCRYSPTSMNSESFYFVIIKDKKKLEYLSTIRGRSSDPIRKAPFAVAVCIDPEKTKRVYEDGIIAAYHFILSSWNYGLGTCWIAAMDREDVKECLNINKEHYIATITPLGFPYETKEIPDRRKAEEFVNLEDFE